MNNETTILFHKVRWFLTNEDTNILLEEWKQSIKDFIYNGYREGEFAVEFNNESNSLRWLILFD